MISFTDELRGKLHRHYLFSVLDEKQEEILLRHSVLKTVAAGEMLWFRGETYDALAVLLDGTLKISVIDQNGNEFAIRYINAVDSLGDASIMGERGHISDVFTVDECTVLFVEKAAVRVLINNNAKAAAALCAELSERVKNLTRELKMQVLASAEIRIMHRLLQLLPPGGNEISTTHSRLAELVGITRERLTTGLGKIENDGYIQKKRGKIIIKNTAVMMRLVNSAVYFGEE